MCASAEVMIQSVRDTLTSRKNAFIQGVLGARAAHASSSLADLYDPLAMPKDLRDAHNKLDKLILGLYGVKADASDSEILAALIARYKKLESADQLPLTASKNSGKAPKAPSHTAAVRAWAVENGLTVPARGRIPKEVMDAYTQAQSPSEAQEV